MLAFAHVVPGDLYTAPASAIDYELVRTFVLSAEDANLFSESLTFEAKEKLNKGNVAEAVAALDNTDGGVVGAENLCHQVIFVDDATGAVTPPDPEMIQVGDAVWQRP